MDVSNSNLLDNELERVGYKSVSYKGNFDGYSNFSLADAIRKNTQSTTSTPTTIKPSVTMVSRAGINLKPLGIVKPITVKGTPEQATKTTPPDATVGGGGGGGGAMPEQGEEKSAEDKEEGKSDTILGMPKKTAYIVGGLILLVGGYFVYKKFKK